ncbi:MAG: hypothetical protein KDJ26_04300 [Alphaproteobacteria bacterium]|nr:hypothetical protein [Alphaproteobacteria bacterium]MCB1551205.1 hypothetical protein [Alphaproteobacteria bacterium]MCB9985223.1 hypothetical protein [Micavibrio sp.]
METNMQDSSLSSLRLSDRIFFALQLAIQQKDSHTADVLVKALELSMTRNSGGGDFVERRDYPPEIEEVLKKLRELKKSQ